MGALAYRDSNVYTFSLRDTAAKLDSYNLVGPGTFFTEVIDVGTFVEGILFLLSLAHAGTSPTLDIKVQYSPDKLHWIDAGDALTQVTTTDSLTLKKLTANFGRYIRCMIVIGGTVNPNYTFSLLIALKA